LKHTFPIPPDLSRKLWDQNTKKYRCLGILKCCRCITRISRIFPPFENITATVTTVEKYTIVELAYDSKHYHGLTAKADCDEDDLTGMAIAYNRAFKAMAGVSE